MSFYDEEAYAKRVYENGFTDNFFNLKEALLVAKHIRNAFGYGDTRVKNCLIEFCITHSKHLSFQHGRDWRMINNVVKNSREPFKKPQKNIFITENEIHAINRLSSYSRRKMLFVLLVLAKKKDNKISLYRAKEIRKYSMSRISNRQILENISYFSRKGFFRVVGESYVCQFSDYDSSNAIFEIDDRNIFDLKKIFVEYFGKETFFCIQCGSLTEKKSNSQKRCDDCKVKNDRKKATLRKRKQRIKNVTI